MQTIARALAVAALLALAPAAQADIGPIPGPGLPGFAGCASLKITNTLDKWIWITVYDLTRTRHLDYGWITPKTMREWQAGQYSCAGVYYLRAQVKGTTLSSPGPDGPDIFDTTVQITGKSHEWYLYSNQYKDPVDGKNYNANTSFFWSSTPNLQITAEKTIARPRLDVFNSTDGPVMLGGGVWQESNGRSHLLYQTCVQPHSRGLVTLDGVGTQRLQYAEDSNCFNLQDPATYPGLGPSGSTTLSMALATTTRAFYGLGLFGGGAAQYVPGFAATFQNPTATPVQFMIDGETPDKSPCVAPGTTSAAIVLPGKLSVKVTPTKRTKCGDTVGTPLNPQTVPLAPMFRMNYVLKSGFYLE